MRLTQLSSLSLSPTYTLAKGMDRRLMNGGCCCCCLCVGKHKRGTQKIFFRVAGPMGGDRGGCSRGAIVGADASGHHLGAQQLRHILPITSAYLCGVYLGSTREASPI